MKSCNKDGVEVETGLLVLVEEHSYPRRESDYGIWIVEDGKHLFCCHPVTSKEKAKIVMLAFKAYIEAGGEEEIRRAVREGY